MARVLGSFRVLCRFLFAHSQNAGKAFKCSSEVKPTTGKPELINQQASRTSLPSIPKKPHGSTIKRAPTLQLLWKQDLRAEHYDCSASEQGQTCLPEHGAAPPLTRIMPGKNPKKFSNQAKLHPSAEQHSKMSAIVPNVATKILRERRCCATMTTTTTNQQQQSQFFFALGRGASGLSTLRASQQSQQQQQQR